MWVYSRYIWEAVPVIPEYSIELLEKLEIIMDELNINDDSD